ncbi:hypothetical protein B0H63DRAFT_485634 [Podospora didyma]|uniref:Uncharacterized protein n=1 Tax=Podospora didyma TaxID=330526 RepID=A0AAE0K495_9PEZI|nr:hypothetical protein B0H63DRAFT_485634 [Podospora didyma]
MKYRSCRTGAEHRNGMESKFVYINSTPRRSHLSFIRRNNNSQPRLTVFFFKFVFLTSTCGTLKKRNSLLLLVCSSFILKLHYPTQTPNSTTPIRNPSICISSPPSLPPRSLLASHLPLHRPQHLLHPMAPFPRAASARSRPIRRVTQPDTANARPRM